MLYSFCLIFLFQPVHTGGSLVFQSSNKAVDVGENITLECNIGNAFGYCSSVIWLLYQKENGLKIYIKKFRTISENVQQDKLCTLNISTVSLLDNGIFYCLLLNEGMDHVGNGTALIVTDKSSDITNNEKVDTFDHKTDSQALKECSVPLAILGGFSILIILGILAVFACYKRVVLMHRSENNESQQHRQSSSETQYATLKFATRRQEHVAKF